MTGSLILLATTAMLVTSAGLAVASLQLRSVPAYVLGVYVVAWGELVLLLTLLSFAHLVVRWAVVAGIALLLVAALVTWARAGRPPGPSPRVALRRLQSALRDPPLALLAIAVALGFAYVAALALFTPPNSIDALWYHLPRAATWAQEHAVGYVADANNGRLNANPPVAEIGALYTMVVGGTDRFVTMVALAAYATLAVAVFGLARRLFVDRPSALCAALVFAALPVVLLQASGAKNDLVLASFMTACVFFCLGTRRGGIVLAGLALALALGTKIFAPLFLPIVGLAVFFGTPRRRALALVVAAVPAVVAGSAWNVVNAAQTSSSFGELSSEGPSSGRLRNAVATPVRYLIDFAELPGGGGWWLTAYVGAALVLGALLLRDRRRSPAKVLVAAALLGAIPLFVAVFGPLAQRGYRFVLFHLGQARLGILDYGRDLYDADPMSAYYGPVGIAVLLAAFALIHLRREVPRLAVVFATSPFLLVVAVAIGTGYSHTSGRFFVFGMALGVAAFALFLSRRPIVWAAVAVSVPTLVLTLRANTEKPPSIWGKSRWQMQTQVGPNSEQTRLIRFAAESLPRHARLGLALGPLDISYPFFDSELERRIEFVRSTQALPPGLDWLVLAPRRLAPRGPWRQVVGTPGGWRLYERV